MISFAPMCDQGRTLMGRIHIRRSLATISAVHYRLCAGSIGELGNGRLDQLLEIGIGDAHGVGVSS